MENLFKRLKQKAENLKLNTTKQKAKNTFNRTEIINGKKIYHTKLFNDFYTFGVNKKQKNKFLIALKKYSQPNKEKNIYIFHLFSVKGKDEFLGIHYSIKKIQKPLVIQNIEKNEFYTIRWCVCMEFRFKTGSIICYLTNFYSLLRKDKTKTEYYKKLLNITLEIERQVYTFYNKNLPGAIITEWIEKKQK
ncbi:DUF226 domain-containing protein (plasmid) [Borrelia coriaceae]|uniref:Putative cytosolic protein n=1 Tax=Borrelia coriaceae ATCC 43381 TaxID=1408429 RepID=W5T2N3_9SPIR|nr:DUF226 domain-containing protein [Borrelia coriaceae]AHH11586.1 Putative cytosolic protein [Borrelia coriaceae ATCC 43381]UPA17235.1 DUF226 domain-containing protein [Borrelia coriaceae]